VTVNGNPGRNPEDNIFLFASLELEAGEVLGVLQAVSTLPRQDASVTERASSIAGTWGTVFSMEAILQLINTSKLELTEKGWEALASYVEVTDNPGLNCKPGALPSDTLVPDIITVVVKDEMVVIRGEYEAMTCTVFLNQGSHAGAVESIFGDSIGYWEDNTLVIDTTHFATHRQGNAIGLPSGEQKI